MSTWQRMGVALFATVALSVAGIIYQQVFVNELLPMVNPAGTFSQPVLWLDRLAPLIIVVVLLAVWAWVIAGAVQDERTVDRRRVRR